MSPLDTIFGWIMVGLSAIALVTLAVVAVAAWWYDRTERATAAQEYEASPYGPVRKFRTTHRLCELRGHQYGLSEDGTHWVCVRGDDRVPVNNDLDEVERYANGGAA